MNFIRFLKILLIIALLAFAAVKCFSMDRFGVVIFPDGTYFKVEIADTPLKMERGLMFRKSLAEDRGMLFIYPEPTYPAIWMKNCFITLDLIWLSEDGRIVHIVESAPPCVTEDCETYSCISRAKYVLELKGKTAEKYNLKHGDRLKIVLQ